MATDCSEISNWSGNIPPYTPRVCYTPKDANQLLEILNQHKDGHIRVVGSGHSMNEIAKSTDVSIDMSAFRNPDGDRFIDAGMTLEALQADLAKKGKTLPARGTIKLQTIAGAISTGTHGSGRSGLSHYVDAVRIAAYDESGNAKVFDFDQRDPELRAARTALGAMGVILGVKLREEAAYFVEQSFAGAGDLDKVLVRDEKTGDLAYPMQLFVRFPYKWSYYVSRRRVSERGPEGEEEERARQQRRRDNERLNDRLLPCVIKKLVAPGSSGWIKFFYRSLLPLALNDKDAVIDDDDHVQTMRHELYKNQDIELFVPERRLQEADEWLKQMVLAFADPGYRPPQQMVDALQGVSLHEAFVSRTPYTLHAPIFYQRVLADDTMISMTAGSEPFYSILLLSYLPERNDGFEQFADFIGKGFVRLFGARLHWGKVFPLALAPENASSYPELERFRELCRTYDPKGVFRNDFTARVLGL